MPIGNGGVPFANGGVYFCRWWCAVFPGRPGSLRARTPLNFWRCRDPWALAPMRDRHLAQALGPWLGGIITSALAKHRAQIAVAM